MHRSQSTSPCVSPNSEALSESEWNKVDAAFVLVEYIVVNSRKQALKKCLICGLQLTSPNNSQKLNHLLSRHLLTRDNIVQQIEDKIKEASQQVVNQKEIWLENLVKQLILKSQSFLQTDSPYFSKIFPFEVCNVTISRKLTEMAQKIVQNQFSCYNGKRTYATLIQDAYNYKGKHLQAFMVKTHQKLHFYGISYTKEKQNAEWLAEQMKNKIETLEAQHNIIIIAVAADNCQCGIRANQLLNNSVPKDKPQPSFEVAKKTQLSNGRHTVQLRCAAHVGNLFLQDYCKQWGVWGKISNIAIKHKQHGKTDYITYLMNVWDDDPDIFDMLNIIRALTINSASLERLFSFFHRETSSYVRGAIEEDTLIKMGYIYTEKILPEVEMWKQMKANKPKKASYRLFTVDEQLAQLSDLTE
ncbi:Conserved_hypothetical protein [Hexamita inflata]|uniref:Uncharacterized protein n=1 Tax=Hexamita inflata TaxID=28002 RepID=A0AA86R9V4_9EUKA|nr:Conserved hypothetical protein [Hexamita inflata]